jgi:hypothetical protein
MTTATKFVRQRLWSVPIFQQNAHETYARNRHRRPLIDFFKSMDALAHPKTIRKRWIRRDFETLLANRNCPLLRGFLDDEPTFLRHIGVWEKRLSEID